MATSLDYVKLVKQILLEHSLIKPAHGDIDTTVSFDDEHANYALLQSGWDGDSYLHGAVVHISIIEGKIWIQYDGTEEGVATELIELGVPKSQIVLGFRHPSERQYTGLAVAQCLQQGAQEVWVVYEDTTVDIFTHTGQQDNSQFSQGLAEQVFVAIKN